MARTSITASLDLNGSNPATLANPASRAGREAMLLFKKQLEGAISGAIKAGQTLLTFSGAQPVAASGTVIAAGVLAADTVTINGQAITAAVDRASGTITCATALAASTVTVNGHIFTAVSGTPAANEFDISGNDTADAVSLALAINTAAALSANVLLYGLISAKSATDTVTVYAQAVGTAGNAYTLASSDGTTLAVSAATFANGSATAANGFDMVGTNIETATGLAAAINLSSNSATYTKQVEASNFAATITLATCTNGSGVRIAGYNFFGYTTVPVNPAQDGAFSIASTDTNDAAALVVAINTHPVLCHKVVASNSSGVVTVRQRRGTTSLGRCEVIALPSLGVASGITVGSAAKSVAFAATATVLVSSKWESAAGNACTLASSDGTRLAVSAARLAGGTGGDGTQVRVIAGTVA